MDDGYPNEEEEFELQHQDEFELLRELEDEDIGINPGPKSRRSLDFKSPTAARSVQSNKENQNPNNTQQDADQSFERSFSLLESPQAPSRKRTVDYLFGDIHDIVTEELQMDPKKLKTDQERDLDMIERIIEFRKVAKEVQLDLGLPVAQSARSSSYDLQENVSRRIPRFPFMPITRPDGEKIYIRCHSEEYEKEEIRDVGKVNSIQGLMTDSFKNIWQEAERIINAALEPTPADNSMEVDHLSATTNDLWVEMYKPRRFFELLSDESTNRALLRWLKSWDRVVFNRRPRRPALSTAGKPPGKAAFETDESGRPVQKVALLCGPPGLGKTTLAHLVARHAGYNVVEINASDDRSTDAFRTALENSTQMRSLVDRENRPNCLVFDEIDGAPPASIDLLVKFISGGLKPRKGKKAHADELKRPIICICNDVYVPALRPLRQVAFTVIFPPTASARLAERLDEIARHQGIVTDFGALFNLCEKTRNDVRSCLAVLQFFKAQGRPITLSDVHKTSIGEKDMHKSLFAVWQDIFQIERSKGRNGEANDRRNNMSLRSRMTRILNVVNSFGDHERLAQGVFENYPNLKLRDSTMPSICEAMEWFCHNDILNSKLMATQNYSISTYLSYGFVVWHFIFGTLAWQKIAYPSKGSEVATRSTRCRAVLAEVLRGMQPQVRAYIQPSCLRDDVVPLMADIIVPNLRPVSLQLYSPAERQALDQVVAAMVDYNLNYVQERTPEGSYVFKIDPDIEELAAYPGLRPRRCLSYATKQMVAREIEVYKMKKLEESMTRVRLGEKQPSKDKGKENARAKEPKKTEAVLPNHLQRLQPISFKKPIKTISKDFFGRIITKDIESENECDELMMKTDIWYHFKEGFSNAVRKNITIEDLL